VEYLTLFERVFQTPRFVLREWLSRFLDVDGRIEKFAEEDAGTAVFLRGDAEDLWNFRCRIGKALSDRSPAYRRALQNWRTKPLDERLLPPIGRVPVAPPVESLRPVCDRFKP